MILFLKFLWLLIYPRQGQKVFIRHVPLCRSGDPEHRAKGDGRPPVLHLNCLWKCSQLSPQRISTWCMILRLSGLGLEPTPPVHWAEMLTTRPPSPWSQHLFSLYVLLCWLSQLISANHLSFVFLEYTINLFLVFHTLYALSAIQSPAALRVKVVSQSEFTDVTLGSSRTLSAIHGSCFKTLSLLLHSVRIIH